MDLRHLTDDRWLFTRPVAIERVPELSAVAKEWTAHYSRTGECLNPDSRSFAPLWAISSEAGWGGKPSWLNRLLFYGKLGPRIGGEGVYRGVFVPALPFGAIFFYFPFMRHADPQGGTIERPPAVFTVGWAGKFWLDHVVDIYCAWARKRLKASPWRWRRRR